MTASDRLPGAVMWLWRIFPGTCLGLAFGLLSILFLLGNTDAYSAILWQMGVDPFVFPFLDSHGVLATAECHGYGFDVIAENPCDVLGRTLDYSPFWLLTTKLGLHTGLTQIAGLSLDLLFLFWIFFLPPSQGWLQALTLTLALLSSTVGFALERANLDLAIFVVAIVAANWALRGTIWRMLGYGFITLAALVKYYPGILLILAIRERLVLLVCLAVTTIAITALFAVTQATDILRTLAQIENGSWFTDAFGAQNLSRGLVELFSRSFAGLAPPAMALELAFVAVAVIAATAIARTEDLQGSFDFLPQRSRVLLLAGCALMVSCFFAAQNAPYRGIYFLFVLPGIAGLCASPIAKAVKHRFILTILCILVAMWGQFLYRALNELLGVIDAPTIVIARTQIAFWFLREILWWWIVTILLAFLLCLIYQSEAGQQLLQLMLPKKHLSAAGAVPAASPAGTKTHMPRTRGTRTLRYCAALAIAPFGSSNSPVGKPEK
jgi:hypothetical protein